MSVTTDRTARRAATGRDSPVATTAAGHTIRRDERAVKRSRMRRPHDRWALLYLLPAVAASGLFVVYPLLQTAWYSLHKWNGLSAPSFIGLKNYVDKLSDPVVQGALLHSLVLILFFSVIPVALGLVFAALLARRNLPGMGFFRTVLFLPQVVTLVVTGIAWRWMFSEDGSVNQILTAVGLGDITRAWFGDFDWALVAVGVVGIWVVFGFCMILFLAGISKIDPSLYDAARMDGAGPITEFFAVTLPGLKPELGIALTITMIGGLRSFDIVYVTTGGGPGRSTNVPALEVYQLAFVDGTVGSAAAVAIILTLIILSVTGVLRRLFRVES